MNRRALAALACPHCRDRLSPVSDRVIGCGSGHRFDLARSGYLALLGTAARTDTGDSAAMVAARVDFLAAGHYRPIAAALADAVGAAPGVQPLLDLGAGTGYYTRAVLDAGVLTSAIALDSAKSAARRAAADERVLAVVADAWSALPVATAAVGAVINVFAPRVPAEVARVLTPGGTFVAVTPQPDHLLEIRGPLAMLDVDPGKADRLADRVPLPEVGRTSLHYRIEPTRTDIAALVGMGPTARHRDTNQIRAAIDALPADLPITVSVTLSVFRTG